MDRKMVLAGLSAALMLQACDRPVAPSKPGSTLAGREDGTVPARVGEATAPRPSDPPSVHTDSSGVTEGDSEPTPPMLVAEADKGIEGARSLLLSFARALELKEFDRAWALLAAADKRKWSRAGFARLFADLRNITVAVPGGTMEGAAGSLYYAGPVTIAASDKSGRPVRFRGEAVLRRVNEVVGATPAQRRWHFDRLTLEPMQGPRSTSERFSD